MTIERDELRLIEFYCDHCSNYQETPYEDFAEALDSVKSEGWKVRKAGKDWEHTCPDCQTTSFEPMEESDDE